jgi:hypothetical protein
MFIWFSKLFQAQVKLGRFFYGSPIEWDDSKGWVNLLQNKKELRNSRIVAGICFSYVGTAVWNQFQLNISSSLEKYLLSLSFMIVIFICAGGKFVLMQRTNTIIQLYNTLKFFEIANAGNNV